MKNMSKRIIIPVFFLVLLFPLANSVFNIAPKSELVERRRLAGKPELTLDSLFAFAEPFTRYYNDHFPLRGRFIFWSNLLRLKLFGISAIPKVVVGKQGWLFMHEADAGPSTVDYYRSARLFSRRELAHWAQILEERRQWLSARGIHYLFLIAPNKNSIYPGKMPDNIRRVRPYSRMDQLVSYLRTHTSVQVPDVRKALLRAKTNYPVYSRTDTHWNAYGSYIAYREIMKYISRWFNHTDPLPLSRFKVHFKNRSGGDLAEMLSLHREIMREDIVRLRARPPLQFDGAGLEKISRLVRQGLTRCPTAPLPNILMVHDSFYKRLKPYLSASFSRVFYIWDWSMNFYPEIIEREKPKLVVDEMAERFLMAPPPRNPELIRPY